MRWLLDRETRWRVKREARAYIALLLRPRLTTRRLLIFAQGRTGSTLLESLLESTGHFDGKSEVLGALNEKVRLPISYIRGVARIFPQRNIVAHVKIYQLGRDRIEHGAEPIDPGVFLRTLHEKGWDIVALRRRDKFDHYISGCLARARGDYHKVDDKAEDIVIEIDREDLLQGMARRAKMDEREAAALAGVPHFEIVYEDDLMTPEAQQDTISRLLDHLGLEPRPAKTPLRKINSKPRSQVIANYEDARLWAAEMQDSLEAPMSSPAARRKPAARPG